MVHYDEHTPHMHFGFVPLTTENKLCAKKQLANESREKKLSKEISSLQKENKNLKTENESMKTQLNKRQSVKERLAKATLESELRELRRFKDMTEKIVLEQGYRIISEKHSYILIIGIYKRYVLPITESEHFGNKEDKGVDLRFTDAQKLDMKKALKRGIYQELYDRDYLSDMQLNELIGRNT